MNYFNFRIKEIRELKQMTQEKLATTAGISQSYLSEVEEGKYEVSLPILWQIALALEVCPMDLVECVICPLKKPGK